MSALNYSSYSQGRGRILTGSWARKGIMGLIATITFFFGTLYVLDWLDPPAKMLVMAELSNGRAISSFDGPERAGLAFDGRSDTFWYSDERGGQIRDKTWIGYRFVGPFAVRRVVIEQPEERAFRQDYVNIEYAQNGKWVSALPNVVLTGRKASIDLPPGPTAQAWRIVAAGDNATAPEHMWRVFEVTFFIAS